MHEPLKNMLNSESLRQFALVIKSAYEPFLVDVFVKSVMSDPLTFLRGCQHAETLSRNPFDHAYCQRHRARYAGF